MKHVTIIFALTLVLAQAVPVVGAPGELTNPYEILQKHIDAIGGWAEVTSDKPTYVEATITVSGLTGTVKDWQKPPSFKRTEVDLKVFQQVSGDNGEYGWSVDQNGKVQIARDEPTLKRRQLAELLAEYEHLKPESPYFDVVLEGLDTANGRQCYVIRTTNTINEDVGVTYYNVSSFLIERSDGITPDQTSVTRYSDFRQAAGVVTAFRQNVVTQPGDQHVTVEVTKFERGVSLNPELFEPPHEDAKDYRFTSGTSAEDVRFEYIHDHLFLPVNINGKERLWFLDTGAGASVIDSGFAAERGLASHGKDMAQGTGAMTSYSFVQLPAFSTPGIEFDPQVVISIDLKGIVSKMGLDVVGILGFDFLSRFVVKIDYANQLVSFYDPAEFAYTGEGVSVEAALMDNTFNVPLVINGRDTAHCNLDIGAGGVDLHYPFARDHAYVGRKGVDVLGMGAGGSHVSRECRFESLEIGGMSVRNQIIGIPLADLEGTFGGTEAQGNIGNSLLRHFIVYFDYADQRVILEKGADFQRVFPEPKSGLQTYYNADHHLEVVFIADGTPARQAGFEVGDIIIAVNDVVVEFLDGMTGFRDLMRAETGTIYKVTIEREGVRRDLLLTLADLY